MYNLEHFDMADVSENDKSKFLETLKEIRAQKMKPKMRVRNLSDSSNDKVKAGAIPAELYMSYDELDKANKIAAIKKNDYTLYGILFFDKFKKWPPDFTQKSDHNVKSIYQNALRAYTKDTLSKMSWEELTKDNKTTLLKELDPETYKQKFFKRFGNYPKF